VPANNAVEKHLDHKTARSCITHPALLDAFDRDWYYPWPFEYWPEEDRKHPLVQKAIKEGWAEWIQDQADLEAVKQGYFYDLSRDRKGRPVYWHEGRWVRWIGKGKNRKLEEIPIEQAEHNNPDLREIVHFGAGDVRCRFIELFVAYTKASMASEPGDPYRFIYWQRLVLLSVFGWVREATDRKGNTIYVRRYRKAWLMFPKKNGKSDFVSAITIIMLKGDKQKKAYIYGAACDKDQAGVVFEEARDYVRASPYLRDVLFINDSRVDRRISDYESGSFYKVVSSDVESKDGVDAQGVIHDEIHQHRDRKLYVIFKRAGQARIQPLEWVITTYGRTLKSIWGEIYLKAKAIISGKTIKISQYVMIASAEPIPVVLTRPAAIGDTVLHVHRLEQSIDVGEVIEFESSEPNKPNVTVITTAPAKRFQRFLEVQPISDAIPDLSEGKANEKALDPKRLDHAIRRSNPSCDIVMPHERIKEEIIDAEGPQGEAEAKRYNLNIIAGDGNLWLSGAAWLAGGRHKLVRSQLLGARCFGGLDVSQSNDLTAFWLSFPNWERTKKFGNVKNPLLRLLGLVWVPEHDIEKREEIEEIPYRALAEAKYFGPFGFVRICPGETIRYDQVGADIVELCNYFKTQCIAYDPHRAGDIIEDHLMPAGLKCMPHRQGAITMGPASMKFENLVKRRAIAHGNHPILDAAIEGCVLTNPDAAGNKYPAKDRSISRIDPLIAAIMATNWACHPPKDMPSGGAYAGASS
jgi:phage terminase large subunit-like protein